MSEEIEAQPQETIAEERPSWLPDNFKSPEDLARSYKEAQGKLTQQAQELSQLRTQVEEIAAAQQTYVQQTQYSDAESRLYEAVASGDPQEILAAQAWIAQQSAQQAVQEALKQYQQPQQPDPVINDLLYEKVDRDLSRKYDDWHEVKVGIADLIKENPKLANEIETTRDPRELASILDTQYKVVKFNQLSSQQQQVVQQAEEANRLMKQSAQTITGASQGTEPPESYWDQVKATPPGDYQPVGRL